MAYYGANFARKAGRATPNMLHPKEAWKRPPVIRDTPKITVTATAPDPPEETKRSPSPVSDAKDSQTDSQTDTSDKKESESESSDSDSDDSDSDSESSETDTEVEESDCPTSDSRGLRSIRSVPNINAYSGSDAMDSPTTETDEQSDDSYDGEDDVVIPPEHDIPHQLSVIIEESEISDVESVLRAKRETTATEDESSATAIDTESDSDIDPEDDSTVMVSLPLKLKFSRSENDEEVTTVIVGDVRRTSLTDSDSPGTPQGAKGRPFEFRKSDADDSDVSVTFTLPSRSQSVQSPSSDCTEDEATNGTLNAFSLPKHLRADEQNIPYSPRQNSSDVKSVDNPTEVSVFLPFRPKRSKPSAESASTGSEEEDSKTKSTEESDCHWEDDSSSTSIQTVRGTAEKPVRESNSTDSSKTELVESNAAKDGPQDEYEEEEEFGWGEDGTIVKIGYDKSTTEEALSAALNGCATDNSDDESCSSSSSDSSRRGSEKDGGSCSNTDKEIDQRESESKPEVVNKVAVNSQLDDIDDNSDEFGDSDEEADVEGKPEEVEEIVRSIIATMKSTGQTLEHSNGDDLAIAGKENTSEAQIATEKNGTSKGESEEEDSGVTSDMSRHISEAENEECSETSKKRKLSRYQRASTHSRLFKLLQEESTAMNGHSESTDSSATTDLFYGQPPSEESINSRKERLTLPLLSNVISDPDSLSSSSGITSPASPTVTDRLVTDLVQTLLQRKKGKKFRKLPMAKLHAAALRILQEDMDPYDTLSSTSEEGYNRLHMSPVNPAALPESGSPGDGAHSSPYGSNYNDYCSYYNTWNGAPAEYDIMPSRAFKLLDQHAMSGGFSPGIIEGLMAKCPRVRSSKQVNHDLSVASGRQADSQPQDDSQSNHAGTVAVVREDL